MATTITRTQTVASADAGWSVPLDFPRFDLSQGIPLGVQVGVTGTINGSAAIENLGAAAADIHVQLPGTISVAGPDGTLLTSVAPDPSQIIHLGAYDGTTDFSGNSGTIVSNISASATAASVFLVGTSGPVPFGGTGTLALTAGSQASSSVAGNGNLLVVTHAQAGAAISVQYDYQAPVNGVNGVMASGNDIMIGGGASFVSLFIANEQTTAAQTLIVPDMTAGWNTTLAAAQFNPALGTLTGVNLALISDINGGFAAENLGSTAGSVNMSDTAVVTISLPGTIGVLSAAPSVTGGGALSQFDGTVDFAGHSGIDQTVLTNIQSQFYGFHGDLSSFIGTGTIALPIGANSTSLVTGPADLESKLLTKAGAVVMVSYSYVPSSTPPVVSAPAISGTVASQATTDQAALAPFANVTIADANSGQPETVTVTQNGASNGTLSNLHGGSYNATIGIYTYTGSATEVADALDGLIFTPTAHQVAPGQTVSTGFTITDSNSAGGIAPDQTTSVVATAIATPVISGIVAAQQTYQDGTINPFASTVISDPNGSQTETVEVMMSSVLLKNLSFGGFNGTLADAAGGTSIASYGVSGWGFTGSAAQVTNWLQQLVFTPSSGFGRSGIFQTTSTGFTLTDTDTAGASASASTTVGVTAQPPVIGGVNPSQTMTDAMTLSPFAHVTIGDPNANGELVTVTLSAPGNGTLSNLGGGTYDATLGVYTDFGSAVAVTAALDGLVFTPTPRQVAPGQTVTTGFTIGDQTANAFALEKTMSVITTATLIAPIVIPGPYPAPRVLGDPVITGPLITGTTAKQAVIDQTTIKPFAHVTISDPNVARPERVTVILGAPANGTLSNLGGGTYDATLGIYIDLGSAVAVTAALDGLVFTPTPQQVAPGQSVTTGFTITDTYTPDIFVTDSTTTVIATAAGTVLSGEVVLHGSAAQYVIAADGGSLSIQDTVAGRDGTRVLAGVTEMVFTDGTGVFDPTGTAEDVARLYKAALGRVPDASGLEAWTIAIDDSHVPLGVVANSFATSPEFIQHYGTLSDATFVNQLYQNVLGRQVDAPGALYWDGVLTAGTSRGTVTLTFAESLENRATTLSTAGSNANAEVYRLYETVLGRAPEQAGQAVWSSMLASGGTSEQVAQSFINSSEFQQKYGGTSDGVLVSALYQNVMNRPADLEGLQFWTKALQQGQSQASVVVAFADSLESRSMTADATHANWVFIPT